MSFTLAQLGVEPMGPLVPFLRGTTPQGGLTGKKTAENPTGAAAHSCDRARVQAAQCQLTSLAGRTDGEGFEPPLDLRPEQFSRLPPDLRKSLAEKQLAETPHDVLAFCLALLSPISPDLALVVKRWETLPEPIRAGILAMVRAAG